MSDSSNENAGVRWLSIFEGVTVILIATALIGIGSIFITTNTTNTMLDQLVNRFNKFESRTDDRLTGLETRVTKLEVETAKGDK